MIALGTGHLVLVALAASEDISAWVDRGMWAAVPFLGQEAPPTEESLGSAVTFWAGPGGFAVPLILLGSLIWHLGERGMAVPAGIGWGLTAWCVLDGVLLGPSPFFAMIIPGALLVLAAHKGRTRTVSVTEQQTTRGDLHTPQ